MYGYKAKNGGSSETAYDFKTLLGAKRAVPEGYITEIFNYEKEVPQKIKAIGEIPTDAEFICKYQKKPVKNKKLERSIYGISSR